MWLWMYILYLTYMVHPPSYNTAEQLKMSAPVFLRDACLHIWFFSRVHITIYSISLSCVQPFHIWFSLCSLHHFFVIAIPCFLQSNYPIWVFFCMLIIVYLTVVHIMASYPVYLILWCKVRHWHRLLQHASWVMWIGQFWSLQFLCTIIDGCFLFLLFGL